MSDKYFAPGLKEAMTMQGRHMRWLAAQVEVDPPLLSHAMAGRRTIDGDKARSIAKLIGVPFSALFKSPDGECSTHERSAA